jgi:3-phosphoglycerate kinase
MARKKFPDEQVAQIVVEAMFTSVRDAANKYGIAERTIERWRDKVEINPHLSRLVEIKKRAFQRRWVEEAGAFISQGFAYLHKAANSQNLSAEMIHAIAGAMKIASEIVTIREVLDARLSGQDREDNTQD